MLSLELFFSSKKLYNQVFGFNNTLINIFSNHNRNRYVTFDDKDHQWTAE